MFKILKVISVSLLFLDYSMATEEQTSDLAYVKAYLSKDQPHEDKQQKREQNINSFKNQAEWDQEHGVKISGSVQETLYPKPAPLQDDYMPGIDSGVFDNSLAPGDTDAIFQENDRRQ